MTSCEGASIGLDFPCDDTDYVYFGNKATDTGTGMLEIDTSPLNSSSDGILTLECFLPRKSGSYHSSIMGYSLFVSQ